MCLSLHLINSSSIISIVEVAPTKLSHEPWRNRNCRSKRHTHQPIPKVSASRTPKELNIKVPFTPFGRPVRLGPDAGLVWHRTYPRALLTPNRSSDARSRITLEPIKGPNGCFRKQQPFFAHNLKKNSISLFNSFTTGCLSVQCDFVLLVEWILREIKHISLSNDPCMRTELSEHC